MREVDEVARTLADAFRAKYPQQERSVRLARLFVREQMRHESYNVMDQVEAAVERLLWPNVRTQDIPRY